MSDDPPNPSGWPENGAAVALDDLAQPICEAIRFAYELRRKNRKRDIPWDSFETPESAHGHNIRETLRAEHLRYSDENQNRDCLEEIIGCAIRLGIEQGHRMAHSSSEYKAMKITASINSDIIREAAAKRREHGPFEAGAMAYRADTPITTNPYPAGTHDRADWVVGWQFARSLKEGR